MAKLTREDVLKLARLARLEVSEDEVQKYADEVGAILQYVEVLNNIDMEGVEPTNQVTGLSNVMRKDEVVDYQAKPEDLLRNAPAVEDGHIKVKRMLG